MTHSRTVLSEEIGARLRHARQSAALSLAALSDRTEGFLSKSRISNYEQGLRRMGIEEARTLASALGSVSPAYLLCLDDSHTLTADEIALIAHYRGTDAQGRIAVLDKAADEARRAEPGATL